MLLPVSSSSPWEVHDYRDVYLTSAGAVGGVAQVELRQVPQDELWLVERIVVSSTSVAKTQARLYLDAIDASRMIDGTRSGNFDVADQASPIQLHGGTVLLCQWTGADVGARGTLRAQTVILRRT